MNTKLLSLIAIIGLSTPLSVSANANPIKFDTCVTQSGCEICTNLQSDYDLVHVTNPTGVEAISRIECSDNRVVNYVSSNEILWGLEQSTAYCMTRESSGY